MVGRNYLQIVGRKPVPEFWLVLLLAQRRSKHVLGLFKAFPRHLIFDRKKKILRTRLGECRQSTVASLSHLIERILTRKMNDVHRNSSDFSKCNRSVHSFGFGSRRPGQGMMNGR